MKDHGAGSGRQHLNLHLHGLENEQRLVLGNCVAWFGNNLPHVADQLKETDIVKEGQVLVVMD